MTQIARLESEASPRPIRIFRSSAASSPAQEVLRDERVFVTIGAGETRITVLDDEGICDESWTAIFGWGFLFDIPLDLDGSDVTLDEPEAVRRALTGEARIYGKLVDTRAFIVQAMDHMRQALDAILSRTVGSGARFISIVVAAPQWLHGLLSGSAGIRPHILHEISDI